jgi:hypothetical protein
VAGGAALAAAGAAPVLASAIYAAFGGDKDDWRGSSVAYAALAQNASIPPHNRFPCGTRKQRPAALSEVRSRVA